MNSRFILSVDGDCIFGDDGHGRSSVFTEACYGDFVKKVRVFVRFF